MYHDDEKSLGVGGPASCGCGGSSPTTRQARLLESYSRYAKRRYFHPIIMGLSLGVALLWLYLLRPLSNDDHYTLAPDPTADSVDGQIDPIFNSSQTTETRLHFLISADKVDIDLCRILMTSGVLGYPSPSVLGRENSSDVEPVSGIPKFSRVLGYLNSLEFEEDNELVLIIDGDDIQFQLPLEVLLSRYHSVNNIANARLRASFARDRTERRIQQSVIFGADKRCTPGATREEACYVAPPSPASSDLYGNMTDVATGYNGWFHYRQKYVNPGYVIGTVAMVRNIFERAEQLAKGERKAWARGNATEQAVFGQIFSEQEQWRNTMRQDSMSNSDGWFKRVASRPKVEPERSESSTKAVKLDPEENYEFGIGVDYLSELGHSTMNSDIGRDTQWLTWSDPDYSNFFEQANEQQHRDSKLDCPVNVPDSLPEDILYWAPPFHLLTFNNFAGQGSTYDAAADQSYHGPGWNDVPLYTHLCFGTVPVMIHLNGDKHDKDKSWKRLWLWQRAGALLQMQREDAQDKELLVDVENWTQFKKQPGIKDPGGAWINGGEWHDWWDICPYEKYGQNLIPGIS